MKIRFISTFLLELLLVVISCEFGRCARSDGADEVIVRTAGKSAGAPFANGNITQVYAEDETEEWQGEVRPRFFLESDMVMQLIMQATESLPPALRGPLLFALGFSQQSIKNLVTNVRSLGQMIVSSLVIMAVKKFFFADLPTEADRRKAGELTDGILNIIELIL